MNALLQQVRLQKCTKNTGYVFQKTVTAFSIFLKNCYIRNPIQIIVARVAESVDALVSNTSDSNIVSVRPRSRVQNKSLTD
jgi:hypothetical protein